MPATLTQLLEESAARWPEQVALSDSGGDRALTYRHLGDLAGDLAAQLSRHRIASGDQMLLARAGSEYPSEGYPDLRFVRSCSAPLAPAVQQDLENAFSAPVLQAYGMTETTYQAASNPLPANGPDKTASVGIPTGPQIQITRPDCKPAPAGETGEIWIRGATVTSGYLGNPQATAGSFTAGWFRSGDLGHQDADSYLFLTGRIKEIINRGGEKISPAAVDQILQSAPSVEDALSFGVPDKEYGEDIQAAVVLRPGRTATEAELKDHARSRLSAFEVPKRIFFLDHLPRTEKGTGDRRRLAALLEAEKNCDSVPASARAMDTGSRHLRSSA